MANQTTKVRSAGTPARRTLTAAARAAAKRSARSERGGPGDREELHSSRTLLIERPDGWDDPPEPSAEEEPKQLTPGPVRGRRLLTAALCVVLVAGLVAVAVLGWQYREGRRADQARSQALTAAKEAAPIVLSYDYRHLDQDFARARGRLTGGFRDQYLKTTKTVVGPTAAKYHGVVKATVAAASVVSAAPDKAVVLLFVNQTTQSTQVPGSRLDLNRVRMTLTRTSTGWKVSAVDAL
ncbi:hypothetical protein ACWEWI_05655 [Streptomyces sp. NPDC003753]|uniref:hypothetical protein n=1 Tax=Streptomyces sp. NPDC058960 TaxID=3346679 RepID=UPI003680628A